MMFRESALLAVMPGLRFHPHSATRSWNRRATLEIQDYSAATICSVVWVLGQYVFFSEQGSPGTTADASLRSK
jgi:hypothetical protein